MPHICRLTRSYASPKNVRRRCDPPRLWPAVGKPCISLTLATANGITFIGPKAETMRALGDKASAQGAWRLRRVCLSSPRPKSLGDDMKAIKKEAAEVGYPLMLKGLLGRRWPRHAPDQCPRMSLEEKVLEGRREAEAAFGNGEGYLEKMITARPSRRGADPRRQPRPDLPPVGT